MINFLKKIIKKKNNNKNKLKLKAEMFFVGWDGNEIKFNDSLLAIVVLFGAVVGCLVIGVLVVGFGEVVKVVIGIVVVARTIYKK